MNKKELIEHIRWIDIPDFKKYKELLESKDKEVIKLAIELLVVDGIEECQIRRCREKFLGAVYLGNNLIEQISIHESKYYKSPISIVV